MAKAMSRSNIAVSPSVVRPTVRDKTIFSIEETRKDDCSGLLCIQASCICPRMLGIFKGNVGKNNIKLKLTSLMTC